MCSASISWQLSRVSSLKSTEVSTRCFKRKFGSFRHDNLTVCRHGFSVTKVSKAFSKCFCLLLPGYITSVRSLDRMVGVYTFFICGKGTFSDCICVKFESLDKSCTKMWKILKKIEDHQTNILKEFAKADFLHQQALLHIFRHYRHLFWHFLLTIWIKR